MLTQLPATVLAWAASPTSSEASFAVEPLQPVRAARRATGTMLASFFMIILQIGAASLRASLPRSMLAPEASAMPRGETTRTRVAAPAKSRLQRGFRAHA